MNVYIVLQIVLSVLLIAAILVQQRGAGLGSAWGGEGQLYRSRRGVEKILFIATIILAILFAVNGVLAFLMT